MRYSTTHIGLLFLFACLVLNAVAKEPEQQRIYLSEVLEPTVKKHATYYLQAAGMEEGLYVGKIFTMDDKLKAEGHFRDEQLTVEEGAFVFYHPNGKVESRGAYVMGNKSGIWERFDVWGGALAEKIYDPSPLENILYTRAETMPEYPGGEKVFVSTIRSRVTKSDGKPVTGKVMTSFVVEKNGDLTDVKVIEGKDAEVDDQVVDVIKSTSPWAPGHDKGVPVRVQMRIPVQF
ncbi:MAG: TonB family protein [Flavobacteriales bacterium]|nr:TonB family protein [Flavobacteriales bacterium]MBK6549778.1 TonB family protein [Flavobacteriales bacterium]MBK6883534.1 TonB family protein [Flavobacteriales bacterium]MBK7102295.1 TonB family protein [Flavobacteriales bacterium]MBK7113034.1 TonB family protein [Flavobacteriales bacterium]